MMHFDPSSALRICRKVGTKAHELFVVIIHLDAITERLVNYLNYEHTPETRFEYTVLGAAADPLQ